MTTPIFEPKKAVEAFLYVAGRLDSKDIHRIFKVLYFADREHLAKYGRPITSDTYVKYPYGPVPSNIYAMVNSVKGGQECSYVGACGKAFSYAHTFTASGRAVAPLREANLYVLSQTDVDEMDASIASYGKLSFNELTEKSHGAAWQAAEANKEISMESIMREAGEGEDFIAYICENYSAARALAKL